MTTNTQQLTFVTEMYKAQTKETNLIKNLVRLINNLKYLQASLDSKRGYMPDDSANARRIAFVANKCGYALFYLATLCYRLTMDNPEYRDKSLQYWVEKTTYKRAGNLSEPLSYAGLYDLSFKLDSMLRQIIFAYRDYLLKSTVITQIQALTESVEAIKDELKRF